MTARLVVADDHTMFREGLVAILSSLSGVDVVGEATDGLTALRVVGDTRPDLVVMDLHMPRMDGVEATRRVRAEHPATKVLVLTMLADDESVFAALDAGASGYLLKESGRSDLARAIEAVLAGQSILDGGVSGRVLAGRAARPAPDPTAFPHLTGREREILDLLAAGLTNGAIAERLVLSDKTVRNHVSNIFAKIHVTDRAAAVARARDAGYGSG